ncbi:SDR family NAD(P)-dependent oxidoreductase [Pseudalkalibacillus sp. R45]|uniref:SDR family NAD(P)-dependent oxidoreductase n=1 Tax=Pseudalkalibacillus sp. R45 TaxID=3457433 RepID=UPI003FCCA217
MEESEKVAIVTGAAQGLGFSIAKKFVADGMKVVFIDKNQKRLNEIKESRFMDPAISKRTMFLNMDASNVTEIKLGVRTIMETWGRIDILVNNAGIRKETSIDEIDEEEWNLILSVNLGGTFFFSQAVANIMKNQKNGRIINISSYGGQAGPLTSGAHYCASKAGQLALTKVFARDLSDFGVTVNTVAPAAVKSPEMDKIAPEKLERMKAGIPVKRFGEPEEVANIVSYLASDIAGYTTGATFDINGGLLMR